MERKVWQRVLFVLIAATWIIVMTHSAGLAQATFPTHPVTVWVSFPPGGGTDVIIRSIAEDAGKALGQKIVVTNKPGGGGLVCCSLIAKEKPDGYTVAGITKTAVTISPHLTDVDFDPFQDLTYILEVTAWKSAFVVKADSPFKKWEDVVAWAKQNPGQLTFGNPGIGTNSHISMGKIAIQEGFTYKNVPFAGDAPNTAALLGGHVMVSGSGLQAWREHIDAKTIRPILAVEKELSFAPDLPTFKKMGYTFNIVPTAVVICGPKGMSSAVRQALEKAFMEGMKSEAFKKVAKNLELIVSEKPLTGNALLDDIKKTSASYEGFIKELGVYKSQKK